MSTTREPRGAQDYSANNLTTATLKHSASRMALSPFITFKAKELVADQDGRIFQQFRSSEIKSRTFRRGGKIIRRIIFSCGESAPMILKVRQVENVPCGRSLQSV